MMSTKYSLSLNPGNTLNVQLSSNEMRLREVVFILRAGTLTDDFKVVTDGRLNDIFSYVLEHNRMVIERGCASLPRVPTNMFFFNPSQLPEFEYCQEFYFTSNPSSDQVTLLDIYFNFFR